MSRNGYNETLMVPNNVRESGTGVSLRTFDNHIKTLNNGLLSVARNLGGMHTKVTELESKTVCDILQRVATLEKTVADLCSFVYKTTEGETLSNALSNALAETLPSSTIEPTNLPTVTTGLKSIKKSKLTARSLISKAPINRKPALDTPQIEETPQPEKAPQIEDPQKIE
jgi:hypothetical protein